MAAPSVFLEIGGTDVSAYLNKQSYEMDRAEVYETWTDGNGRIHRAATRAASGGTQITGKCDVGFRTTAAFAEFRALLASAMQQGGYYNVRAYITNTGAVESFSAFIDVKNKGDSWDLVNGRQWLTKTLTVTEV